MLSLWLNYNLNHVGKVRKRCQHLSRSRFQLHWSPRTITLSRRNPDILLLNNLPLDQTNCQAQMWGDSCLDAGQASQRGSMVVMYRCTARGGPKQTICLHTHLACLVKTNVQFLALKNIFWSWTNVQEGLYLYSCTAWGGGPKQTRCLHWHTRPV